MCIEGTVPAMSKPACKIRMLWQYVKKVTILNYLCKRGMIGEFSVTFNMFIYLDTLCVTFSLVPNQACRVFFFTDIL